MSAPTFETLSAEITQALAKRRDIPPRATARCTLGRDKVMVLVEYPFQKENDSRKLATQTLDWLEKRLRQQFDITGLPAELADLSEATEEVAVQLYLKHISASKPFTMRSFTWRVEDGFADLFGQPNFGSLDTDQSDSVHLSRRHLEKEHSLEKEMALMSEMEALATPVSIGFSADSATDLYADLSEGISQPAHRSSDDLMEFLVPDEAPVTASSDLSSDLDLPTVDLPVVSNPVDDRASDFFDVTTEQQPSKAATELFDLTPSLESDDIVTDEELADEELSSDALDALFELDEPPAADELLKENAPVDSEFVTDSEFVAERQTSHLGSDSLRIEALEAEDLETEDLETESLEAEDLKTEDLETESLEAEDLADEALTDENLGNEDLEAEEASTGAASGATALEAATPEARSPKDSTSNDLSFEDPLPTGLTPEDLTLEGLTPPELSLEGATSEGLVLEELAFEEPVPEESVPEESAPEESIPTEPISTEPAPEDFELEALTDEPATGEVSTSESASEYMASENLDLEEPVPEAAAAREFALEDLVPEELASEELTFKEAPIKESPLDDSLIEEDIGQSDANSLEEESTFFEYDGPSGLPNVYAVIANSPEAYTDADDAYADDATEADADEAYEDGTDENYETYADADEAYGNEDDIEDGLAYDLESDRTHLDTQLEEDIAPIDEHEVQQQREQWAQQAKRSPWAFVGLFGFLVAGVLGFVLTRPCTFGRCDRLEAARLESEAALDQLRTDDSTDSIEAAQQKLRRSIRRLEPIPVWSSYRDEARAAIPAYERQLNALDLVSEAQSKAYNAAVQSQDPPHSVSTWKEIAAQWREATAALSAVPDDSPVYDLAQTKLAEYRANLSTILVRVETESRAEVSLRQAQQSASQATRQAEVASSVEAWEAAAAGWETAVENLRQIPQTTQAYAEAQQMLPEYEQQLRSARDRAEKERSADNRLSEAKQKATEAQRAESESLWTLALDSWNTALVDLESVAEDTSAYSEAKALLPQYTESWNEAGKNQEVSLRFQTIEPSFFLVCGVSRVQICTYAVKAGGVRIDLFEGYDQVIDQSITPPDQRVETVASEQLLAQGNQLLQQITLLSKQAQIPVVLHDSSGEFLARYRPELDGFVRQ
ncbi:MAG: hypothetical protein AAF716_12680 [Cyanobacteria bacterium P01_D01_bin.1]